MKEKHIWLDSIRAFATVAVIFLHTSSPILSQYSRVVISIWETGNAFDSVSRFCVPAFFMLSGALLLGKDYELRDFLKRRFWRIIPPFAFWSMVYIVTDAFVFGHKDYSVVEFLRVAGTLLLNGSKYHLWFVYTLLGLYLFIPIINKWIKNASKEEITYFLVVWTVTILYGIPILKPYLPGIVLINFSGYLGYMVLGYYLSILPPRKIFLPILLFLFGTLVTALGTSYVSHQRDGYSNLFYGYLSPNVVISSIGVFLFFKTFLITKVWVKSMVTFLSKYSYGIYLSHILFLTLLGRAGINWKLTHPVISIPVTAMLCLVASSMGVYLLRRLKYGEYLVGA